MEKLLSKFTAISIRNQIDWAVKVYPEDLVIYINKADLYSILLNLLTNSLKALNLLPKKSDKKIRITFEKQANNLKILFSNNGPPIPERQQEKIFELFVSRYDEGTGLGLPIIREIIDEYNGTVAVKLYPEFEPGTTFEIKIPLEELKG